MGFTLNGRPLRMPSLQMPSMQQAKRLTVHAAPTHEEYPFPPDYENLFPYQRKGVDWLRSKRRALLADDMGLGKTVQVYRAFTKRPRAIVVCPAFLRSTWLESGKKWRPDLRVFACDPGQFEVPGDEFGDVVILSYESLPDGPTNKKQLSLLPGENLSRVTVVVDEAQYGKNHKSQRGAKIRRLTRQAGRAWGLTGTPLEGHPFDLWGTLSCLHLEREAFGSFQGFLEVFRAEKKYWGGYDFGDPEADVKEQLAKVMLRRTKQEVLPDLPRKVYEDVPVSAPAEVTRVLDGIARSWSGEDLPPFEMMSAVRAELAKSRIPALLEQVARFESEKVPLVVFSAHKEPLQALAGRAGWMLVTGETPDLLRQTAVTMFEEGLLSGIAGTIGAMGVGLTLVRASNVLFVDLDWTPGKNVQAEDRLVRIGQSAQSVRVMRMVSDHPVDRRVLALLDQKMALINAVVG